MYKKDKKTSRNSRPEIVLKHTCLRGTCAQLREVGWELFYHSSLWLLAPNGDLFSLLCCAHGCGDRGSLSPSARAAGYIQGEVLIEGEQNSRILRDGREQRVE